MVAPNKVVDILEARISHTAAPTLLEDEIASVLANCGYSNSPAEAAEDLLLDVQNEIDDRRNQAMIDGTHFPVELFGSEGEYVRGSSYCDTTLTLQEQASRHGRSHIAPIQGVLTGLSPQEFERACTYILNLMGCADPHTSPPSDDGGIDFYGRLNLQGRLNSDFPYGGLDGRLNVWLIGQAKHYPNSSVQPSAVRELVGSIELARTGGAIHDWIGLDSRPFDAIVQLFFSTGDYSPGAKRLFDRSGIIAMNGLQVSTFLADCLVNPGEELTNFDSEGFKQRLTGQSRQASSAGLT